MYDRKTVQGATFNMRGQLYRGHTNATALSSSPVVSALGSESDDTGSSPGRGKALSPWDVQEINRELRLWAWLNLYIMYTSLGISTEFVPVLLITSWIFWTISTAAGNGLQNSSTNDAWNSSLLLSFSGWYLMLQQRELINQHYGAIPERIIVLK